MTGRIWTISNVLSMVRVVLVLPIAFCLLDPDPSGRIYAVVLILLAVATDLLDGILARKLDEVTEFGKIIDPLADKIAVVAVVIILTLQGKLPLWFLTIAVVRDIAIFAGGIYVKRLKGVVLQSNLAGKWAVTIVAGLILLSVMDILSLSLLKGIFLFAGTGMLILSFVLYSKRFYEVMFPSNSSI